MPDTNADSALGVVLRELNAFRQEWVASIATLVTKAEYAADQRRADDRHTALVKDLDDEIAERKAKEARTSSRIRWLATGLTLPIAGLALTLAALLKGS